MMNTDPPISSARVKTAWVLGTGPAAIAVLGMVVVRAIPCPRPARRRHGSLVRFTGSGQVDESVVRHANRTIAPLVNLLLGMLGVPRHRYEVAIVNPSTASLQDTVVRVSGFSIDIALLVAMLAAALGAKIRSDVMLTGHIASMDGIIGMVRCVGAKLHAAELDSDLSLCIYPRADEATVRAHPTAAADAQPRPATTGRRLHTAAVEDISQLPPLVFHDLEVLLASLRHRYHERLAQAVIDDSPVARTALCLASDNDARFKSIIERGLQAADSVGVASVLHRYIDYFITESRYPSGLGRWLRGLLLALPPWTRSRDLTFPLLPLDLCLALARLATASEHEDALLLIDVAQGRHLPDAADERPAQGKPKFDANAAVRRALASISAEALAARYGRPLDEARACCFLDCIVAKTHDQFYSCVESSYRQLIVHSHVRELPADDAQVANEAHHLLRDAFAEEGGVHTAEAEARTGTRGGMRRVLDRMTDRLIEELKFCHVQRVLEEIFDPFDRKQKVQFMRALIEHLGNQLPNDIRRRPASDFVEKRELLIRSYVRSRDRLVEAFRSV